MSGITRQQCRMPNSLKKNVQKENEYFICLVPGIVPPVSLKSKDRVSQLLYLTAPDRKWVPDLYSSFALLEG